MHDLRIEDAIALDQVEAVRRTVAISIPINVILGISAVLVAAMAGRLKIALLWFAASLVVNIGRLVLCRVPLYRAPWRLMVGSGSTAVPVAADGSPMPLQVQQHLRAHCVAALFSGSIWAFVAALCDWYASPEAIFYMVVLCGITAGAVTHGFAYSRIPISFISLPLLSLFVFDIRIGGVEHYALAFADLLYLGALIRATRESEEIMINGSRSKFEATSLSRSLSRANAHIASVASEMQERARSDGLTGILNRRGLIEIGSEHIKQFSSNCLMILDLDGFKIVNDSLGHKAGDQVLIDVARYLRELLGAEPLISRIGGDEFVILINGPASAEVMTDLARHLIDAVSGPSTTFEGLRVGVSIGLYVGEERSLNEALIFADKALYAAKQKGRNKWCLFDDTLSHELCVVRDIERDFAQALDERMIEVWYQPILSDGGRKLDSFEALLRWHHPEHGSVSPTRIVGVASLVGLSEQLTRYLVHEVVLMATALGALQPEIIKIALNISPSDMAQLAVDDIILRELDLASLPAAALGVEITEDAAIDFERTRHKLENLSNRGVSLSIDDFGTGFSSLGMLRELHVDRVKIDNSFVTDGPLVATSRSLLDAVMRISQAYGFDVVVEGVETKACLDAVREVGCTIFQGFYFARAMPRDEAMKWAVGAVSRVGEVIADKAAVP